jgi:hypothetical protein
VIIWRERETFLPIHLLAVFSLTKSKLEMLSRQYHGTPLLRSSEGMRKSTINSAATANRALTMSSRGPQIAPSMADRGPPVLSTPPGVEEDTVGVVVGMTVGAGTLVAVGVGETAGVGLVEGVGEASVMRI